MSRDAIINLFLILASSNLFCNEVKSLPVLNKSLYRFKQYWLVCEVGIIIKIQLLNEFVSLTFVVTFIPGNDSFEFEGFLACFDIFFFD